MSSLLTAFVALLPLAARARLQEKAAAPDDELVAARIRIAELEVEVERLRARWSERADHEPRPGFGRLSAMEAAQLAQYQQGMAAAQQMMANPLQAAYQQMQAQQNAFAFYGEGFAQICDCAPRHGRAGFLTGLGGALGA